MSNFGTSNRAVKSITLWDNVDFVTSGSYTRVVDLADYSCAEGNFAISAKGTADTGNLDIVYTTSVDGVNYGAPTDTAILSDVQLVAKRSDVAPYTGETTSFSRFLKFVITEDGTEAITGVTVTLIMQ